MNSRAIRQQFLDFFEDKKHKIVSSAPIVNKNDPSLMFTNAGMNQFKDYFLGDSSPDNPRIADTQKCLRVSGKHNDLEEVGIDSYHHTMFEMLGNWSIGDYFKEEAIAWAWELLTEVYKMDKSRIYITVFEGDKSDNLPADNEAAEFWKKWVSEDRILFYDKKDNFWEMGDIGPCGPCSEIHVDLRSDEERKKISGATLVNKDNPLVVEIWNLVFIQFNRKADGSLESLPAKHIDTGMGFERLCMVLQGKTSNYDTDVFSNTIKLIEEISSKKYTYSYASDAKSDIAMRVVADHIRAVAFAIADGQLPSNTGAGYVIRRILRRAVRYYYSFLDIDYPILHRIIPLLAKQFDDTFPELIAQQNLVARVIKKEEELFLNTLSRGLKRIESLAIKNNTVDGDTAFELFATYGFPIDLTRLIASEKGWNIDEAGFEKALASHQALSQKDAAKETGDWNTVYEIDSVAFLGYDHLKIENARISKYRTVKLKNKEQYQVVLDKTPFYAESGGQVGDKGYLIVGEEKISVLDTQKENDLIIHILKKLPQDINNTVTAKVDAARRTLTENNHTATHLLHAALRQVLGTHVHQKGSLLDDSYLRFDFSHFEKLTAEQLEEIETLVNDKIRENISLREDRSLSIEEAKEAGAMMLFGEKYGDNVRMITFDENYSRELCGGCHVSATGKIGLFKIKSESGIAAGVRRIEAVTAQGADAFIKKQLEELNAVRSTFKNSKNAADSVQKLIEENKILKKEIEQLLNEQANQLKKNLLQATETIGDIRIIASKVSIGDANTLKNLAYQLLDEIDGGIVLLGAEVKEKPQLLLAISESLTARFHAGKLIRTLAKAIKGGGGGQAFFATAGGKDASGIPAALAELKEIVAKA